MQSCRCGPSPFNISYNRSTHLPFKRFERSLIIFDVSLSTLKQSGSGFLHSLSLEKYFSFFVSLKLSAWPCTVIIHEPEMLFIIIKKKGELKAVYGFVSKVILSVWQDEVTRAGESSRTTVCFE